MVASGTPWELSWTVSFSGQRVAAMRWRRSARSASGTGTTWNGRIASLFSGVVKSSVRKPRPLTAAGVVGKSLWLTGVSGMTILRYGNGPEWVIHRGEPSDGTE